MHLTVTTLEEGVSSSIVLLPYGTVFIWLWFLPDTAPSKAGKKYENRGELWETRTVPSRLDTLCWSSGWRLLLLEVKKTSLKHIDHECNELIISYFSRQEFCKLYCCVNTAVNETMSSESLRPWKYFEKKYFSLSSTNNKCQQLLLQIVFQWEILLSKQKGSFFYAAKTGQVTNILKGFM